MMKKLILILLCMLNFVEASAQNLLMKVEIADDGVEAIAEDGTTIPLKGIITLPRTAFKSIFFEYEPLPAALEPVDLGLESGILWASINYGAKQPEEIGDLVPWSSTDIVIKNWKEPYEGSNWRMPTLEEINELCKCDWNFETLNGVEGFRVTGKDPTKSIFLPMTGYVNTETGNKHSLNQGFYWSSTSYDNQEARFMKLDQNEPAGMPTHEKKTFLLAIRPVWGDPAIAWSLKINNVTDITPNSAYIDLTMTIDQSNMLGEYGVQYSTDGEIWHTVKAAGTDVYIAGLSAGTTYYYRGYAVVGGKTFYKPDSNYDTFTTPEYTLALNDVSAEAASKSAKITLTLASNAMSEVKYGVKYALKEEWNDAANWKNAMGMAQLYGESQTTYITLDGLMPDTTYNYFVYAQVGELEIKSDVGSFDTSSASKFKVPTDPVDLGLSVKWAPFNVGAEKETDYGGYFGWGDPTGELTEFNAGIYGPAAWNQHVGGNPEFDIAAAQWKGYWRLPTPEEVMELQACNPTFTVVNGVKGYRFTGKNNNTIFFPLAGIREGDQYKSIDSFAFIWTDSVTRQREGVCFQLLPSSKKLTPSTSHKAHGMSIRPVWDDGTRPEPEPEPEPEPDLSNEIVPGSENDTRTGIIPQDGVDMGTGVKWARWNVGATRKTGDVGGYYAWGDTIQRANYSYDDYLSPYKDQVFTGAFTISSEQDVATRLWGADWRMPTENDFYKLINNCEIEWQSKDGLNGYVFTSRITGENIFFPACGYKIGSDVSTKGQEGSYWTSSYWMSADPDKKKSWATIFYFYTRTITPQLNGLERHWGLPVRAVKP